MMGVVTGGVLGGALLIGWPIYLHLRKKPKRAQVVPSLRVFASASQRRRIRLDSVLLLLARAATVLLLLLLVSEPYVETTRDLPFPRVGEATHKCLFLGVLIEDSLGAMHARDGRTRLDVCREWLAEQLAALPGNVRVSVATTSYPGVSPFLVKEDALALLERMKVVPVAGDAHGGLRRLAEQLAGKNALLVVMAPRSAALWGGMTTKGDLAMPVHFFDTTDHRTPCFVRSVKPGSAPGEWVCRLVGDAESLAGTKIGLSAPGVPPRVERVSKFHALQRKLVLAVDPSGEDRCFSLSMRTREDHPWLHYHFVARVGGDPARTAVVVRENTPAAGVAAQVVHAMLTSTSPALDVKNVKVVAGRAAVLPDADRIVVIGRPALRGTAHAWLERQVARGTRIVCIPVHDGSGPAGRPGKVLADWAPVGASSEEDAVAFLRHESVGELPGILVDGLGGVAFRCLMEPELPGPGRPVVVTGERKTLIAVRPLSGRSRVWALSFPLELYDNSPVFNPVLPLLLDRMLAMPERKELGDNLDVGRTVRVLEWFGQDTLDGALALPDGKIRPVSGSGDKPVWLHVSRPGPYRLSNGGIREVRAANFPRELNDEALGRANWEKRYPRSRTRWLGSGDLLSKDNFGVLGETVAGSARKKALTRYDLSPLIAALLVLFLLTEGVLLFRE